jgi:hypothetical protein
MDKLTDDEKQAILYDALPHYYLNNMNDANKVPLETSLKNSNNYTLNIEEASVNPGHSENKDEGTSNKNTNTKKVIKMVKRSRNQLLKVKKGLLVLFVAKLVIRKVSVI